MTASEGLQFPSHEAACRVAFKEWAAVCLALQSGRQTLILRKGGIHEGRAGFEVKHSEFWLYPTRFHESPDQLSPDAGPFAAQARAAQPEPGTVAVRSFVLATDVLRVDSLALLDRLAPWHVLAPATVAARFHYREPGLFVIVARVHQLPRAQSVSETPTMAGCRSWVELSEPLPTTDLSPVLERAEFERRRDEILAALRD